MAFNPRHCDVARWLCAALMAGCGSSSTRPDASTAVDSGSPPDSGMDAGTPPADAGTDAGSPIVAPADQWTWVDFPESRCASGTPTGMAVNPHAGSTDLMIYFEGGGSCSNATTCWGPKPGATNLNGYDATTFANAAPRAYAILERDGGNPFAGMNMAYVPYCTGDLHAGTSLMTLTLSDGGQKPTYFYGANDLDLFLQRLVPTFPQTAHVWVTGTSAGGYGTFLTFDQVQKAFGVRVDILDDSGPPLIVDGGTGNPGLFAIWGFVAPSGCSPCAKMRDVLNYDLGVQATWSPSGRYGFLTFTEDTVISKDFGYTLAEYPALMTSLRQR